ncbi:hypothetical protein OSH11_01875 [Kaistia dalseonensis]|uniref:AsmA-like C-terminal domain-containing protein n=1 Tax=Kaistia dalseonensis TaxID=410840 RepID=A0ABU0H279_9HYPH|nr:hypothetical protein [Kaistia dalseonensis]MCX5493444.1 hypothetical protein [Kaistia dalseonensis]MDQ0436003.1 hypothetical protein [Kaistia dalseonensis]
MIASSVRLRFAAIALGAASAFGALPALADEPVETAIRSWVSSLDASPNWVAGFAELSYDAGLRTATLKNLTIRSETLATKVEITFGTVTILGYNETADGGFTAVEIKADEGHAVYGSILDAKLTDITAENIGVPSFANLLFDQSHIFTSGVQALAIAAKASAKSVTVGNIELDQTYQGETTHTSFGRYALTGMADGKIDQLISGPLQQESPAADGLLKMRIEKIEAHKYDLDALIAVLDPARYVGGVGDNQWRTALALETYRNFSVEFPDGKIRIGTFEAENLKLRQPPRSLAPFFDAILANPDMPDDELSKLSADNIPSLIGLFGIGAFRLSDLDVISPEVERFHLGDFHINDLSSDGLGEIGLSDLDIAARDLGSIGADRLAVGGFKFPSLDTISAAIKASTSGIESNPLPLIPTMGYAEAIALDVQQAGKKLGSVDRARLDLGSYIGPVPTDIALDMRGLDLDLSQVDDRRAREIIEGLGYDRLQADYGFKLIWREADESLRLEDFKLGIKDLASLSADVMLTGLTRSTIENPMAIQAALPSLMFSRGKIVVQDHSVVDRAIGMQAKKMNQTPEKFRQQVVGALPLFMMVLKNPGFQAKLAPALQAFIRAPGTMTITSEPNPPVPVSKLIETANTTPQKLPDLLSLDIQAAK